MEKYDDCVYFLYPRDLNLKYVKYVLQRGFVVSLDTPRLMSDDYVQTFTEEDVKNFGIEALCKKAIDGSSMASCVVLRIPKAYLGLDPTTDLDMSPIFSQVKKTELKNSNQDCFAPMHNLIYGIYSRHTSGFVPNTNYSPVCNCYGILTEEQRKVAENIVRSADNDKATKYADMLERDSYMKNKYPNTSILEHAEHAMEKKEAEDFYFNSYNVPAKVWPNVPNTHFITDAEFDNYVRNNQRAK